MSDSLALGEGALFIRRVFPVSPKRLWRAWTDAAQIARWFIPSPNHTMVEAQCVPEVGGVFRVTVRHADGEVGGAYGTFLEVDPPRRLSFTWHFDQNALEPGESVVTVEFMPVQGGTELRLTHERLASAPSRDSHVKGWTHCLDTLTRYLGETAELENEE